MAAKSTIERWRCLTVGAVVLGACLLIRVVPISAEIVKAPTFTRDVAPILQSKCEACHRPESMAPMSLITYEEVRPWARAIAQRVGSRQMPPWHIDKTIGIQAFKNDRSLTDEQIDTVLRWVAAGAPKGDPKEAPPPRTWPDESKWQLADKYGVPDLVIRSAPYTIPAVASDAWWRPISPTGLTEPRWVRAIEIRPSTTKGRRVTHHALARLLQDEKMPRDLFTNDPNVAGDGLFMEWAIGKNGDEMRPGSGRLMLPGSKIVWEVHYHAIGEEITDSVELGIYFYPKGQEPRHREVLALFNTFTGPRGALDIPPNQVTTTESFVVLKENARIENFQAHMHLRGKGMSMEALYPDGRRQMLSQVTDFNFNWHNMYIYADDAAPLLPKGTILHFIAWYDNTRGNKSNPDSDQWVGWGDRTIDEMGHAWLNITYFADAEFQAELARRRQSEPVATTAGSGPR
jgi:hypothetical protein